MFLHNSKYPMRYERTLHTPAPHFHCEPKCSLINLSEKSWDGARSGEFKDQEQGEIPVSRTILNHFCSPCRSSGFIARKLCCTERLSFPPRIYKPDLHSWQSDWTPPPCLVSWKAEKRRCSDRRWYLMSRVPSAL